MHMDSKNIFDVSGKTIIITGAAGMLGTEYAKGLSEKGANVVLADLDFKKCKEISLELEKKYANKTLPINLDLTKILSIKNMIKKVVKKYGKIDVLINNAAYQGDDKLRTIPFEKLPLESWNKAIDVNLTGIFLCCQEIGKIMVKQKKGVIINISSTYGIVAPDQSIYGNSGQNAGAFYSASKSGVINLTRYLASYWGKYGIRVNTLSPGGVKKNQTRSFI